MKEKVKNARITIITLIIEILLIIAIIYMLNYKNEDLQKHMFSFENAGKEYENTVKEYVIKEEKEEDDNKYPVKKDDIPIYNQEAFIYFSKYMSETESPKYYIYQENAEYIGGKWKNYILMSDIYVDEYLKDIQNKNMLIGNLDFNNHRIMTKDGEFIY